MESFVNMNKYHVESFVNMKKVSHGKFCKHEKSIAWKVL